MSLARYLSKLGALLSSDGKVQQAALAANVAGNGPAFSAYGNFATQGLTTYTFTKVAFDTELFDTNSNYDTTNYRFRPTVAGYYQINTMVGLFSTAGASVMIVSIYKNGTEFRRSDNRIPAMTLLAPDISEIIYMNGTTDYVEVDAYVGAASGAVSVQGGIYSTFSGSLVRAA